MDAKLESLEPHIQLNGGGNSPPSPSIRLRYIVVACSSFVNTFMYFKQKYIDIKYHETRNILNKEIFNAEEAIKGI